MKRFALVLLAAALAAPALAVDAGTVDAVVPAALLDQALAARAAHAADVAVDRHLVIIDYREPSNVRRFYLIDLVDETAEALLVSHGRGSDPDHDGIADTFSNTPNSKMTSLGGYVTAEPYYGAHGYSLKLHGLDPTNDKAYERAIVIHGASYVTPALAVLGRSWGCPALEVGVTQRVIDTIKGGAFVYVVG